MTKHRECSQVPGQEIVPLRQCLRIGLGHPDYAVARPPQRRVEPQDDLVILEPGWRAALQHRRGDAPPTAQARLHLLKLLWSDAHGPESATGRLAAKAQNQPLVGEGKVRILSRLLKAIWN